MKGRIKIPLQAIILIALIGALAFAAPNIGRFVPTHKIEQPVYCVKCHPEEFEELNQTTHIANFAREQSRVGIVAVHYHDGKPEQVDANGPYYVSTACTMCHNNWDNRERFGLGDFYVKYDSASGIYLTKNAKIVPWKYGLTDANKVHDVKTQDNFTITLTNVSNPSGNVNANVTVNLENWHGRNGLGSPVTATKTVNGASPVVINTYDMFNKKLYGDYFNVTITNNGADNLNASIEALYGKSSYDPLVENLYNISGEYYKSVHGPIAPGETVNTDALISKIHGGKTSAHYALHTTWLYDITRLDAVWGNLSKVSPGPTQYVSTFGRARPSKEDHYDRVVSCDSPENGACHIQLATAGLSMQPLEWKKEVPGTTFDVVNGTNPTLGTTVYYTHEMKYTTGEYAAKPVKLCGACHMNKLPPMNDDGTPIGDTTHVFVKTYNETGHGAYTNAEYHAPTSWAHQQVPCIRCHAHAGINAGITKP